VRFVAKQEIRDGQKFGQGCATARSLSIVLEKLAIEGGFAESGSGSCVQEVSRIPSLNAVVPEENGG
jgi:hypothetical protein